MYPEKERKKLYVLVATKARCGLVPRKGSTAIAKLDQIRTKTRLAARDALSASGWLDGSSG